MLSKRATSFLFCFLLLALALPLHAAPTTEELQNSIAAQNAKIADLEKEITQYQAELDTVGKEKQTLQSAIRTLDLSSKKLAADIKVTQTRIDATNLELKRLSLDISGTTGQITHTTAGLAESLRSMEQAEEEPFVVTFFANPQLSNFLDTLASLQSIQVSLADNAATLRNLKISLETKKTKTESAKKQLTAYQQQLANQKKSLDINRSGKNKLLAETKNKEANYQKILNDKISARLQFEQDLSNLESQLKLIISPGSLPSTGKRILSWPLDLVRITQYFGNTDFATRNPQVYSGRGHNGIDLRASIGTPIKAALSGIVQATGNTDLQRGCYSYGKWVLIRHTNGLSTLYAHFSVISVATGQSIATGQLVGFSGDTGYATGPHLHFAVYASAGVQVAQFSKSINCKNVSVPVAASNAYLNPLSYL